VSADPEIAEWIPRDASVLGLDRARALRLLAPVAAAYRQPQRRYHDTRHLGEALDAVHRLRSHSKDPRALLLATWFHDSVYVPERRDNESQSAAWATRALAEAGFPPELIATVSRLILSTQHHAAAADPDAQVLADADRLIWAAPASRYAEYARGIRAEYRRYSWLAYAHGRRRFLAAATRGQRLFFLATDAEEAAARRNVDRERRCLSPLRVGFQRLLGRDPLDPL
jgi:predicted metal-dependent HD superfamily phosphohydrolase